MYIDSHQDQVDNTYKRLSFFIMKLSVIYGRERLKKDPNHSTTPRHGYMQYLLYETRMQQILSLWED